MIPSILRSLLSLLLCALLSLTAASPARADAPHTVSSPSLLQLRAEVDSLSATRDESLTQEQRARLADLNSLLTAIQSSNDRSQLQNDSTHNVELLLRYKKEDPTTGGRWFVLGPGQESDDDYELLGLYIPAGVSLQWRSGSESLAETPRIARVLEGQRLHLEDTVVGPDTPATSSTRLSLNLPIYELQELDAPATPAVLPTIWSQRELDAQLADAPTD